MNEASSELERMAQKCQVSGHRPSKNELQADGLFNAKGRSFIKAESTLETESSLYKKAIGRMSDLERAWKET